MIIKLTGTTFTKYIGALDSYTVVTTVGTGCTPASTQTIVKKNAEYNEEFTLADGYEVGSAGITVTMGSTTYTMANTNVISVSGNSITITIQEVTNTVYINIPTKNITTGEEDGNEEPDITYSPVSISWIKSAYYKCTDNDITKYTSGNDTSKKFWATQVFTENDLPVGSIITLTTAGYNVRKECWISATQGASSRLSAVDGPATITISADDWESFDYLAFNLSKGSDMSTMTEEEINEVFYIVRP